MNDPFAPTDLFIQSLHAVVRAQSLVISCRERQHGGRIIEALLQHLHRFGSASGEVTDKALQQRASRGQIGRGKDRAETAMDLIMECLGGRVTDIAREMRLAALPRRSLDLHSDRFDQPP